MREIQRERESKREIGAVPRMRLAHTVFAGPTVQGYSVELLRTRVLRAQSCALSVLRYVVGWLLSTENTSLPGISQLAVLSRYTE